MNDTKNRKGNKYTHSDGDICIGIFIDHGEFFKHQGHRAIVVMIAILVTMVFFINIIKKDSQT